ncbi:uncharacterized protein LOC100709991 isoform X2 [Oreochromis niloticus]|uniref:uncharacterized protein LOC100709991 isoform X2 n=1 Tax=Oreochromis niloticus TaxID=8128 RepID=UPI00022AFA06|nr:uncharacterized protein LOC100709991 isoform X2 [Oreochromis niloticus]
MACLTLASYLTCLILGNIVQKTHLLPQASVYQDKDFILADVGENVSLHCFYEGDDSAWILWYKQTLGQKPRLISTFYVYDEKITFHDEFQNNPRFKLDTENRRNNLKISDLNFNDSATYYCACSYRFVLTFAEGITVKVREAGLKNPALVHQSPSETIQPGGSVTLNCTVHTGTCYEEHSVYWFKETEASRPGLIYTYGGKNDYCGRKANPQADACVYNLPMKDLNLSHAGTYYCAVDSCGHIVFGNGTKLDFENNMDSFVLKGAVAFMSILTISLVSTLCVIIKINSCHCSECHASFSDFSIKHKKENKNKTGDFWSECVYFSFKQ